MEQKIKILIVDDHPLMRAVTRKRLKMEDDMMVIAEAIDGVEAVRLEAENSPDIILMDINMPKMDGVTATEKIIANNNQAKIIGLSSNSKKRFGKIMRQAGAVAYHSKTDNYDIFCKSIRNKALNGQHWINKIDHALTLISNS